VWYILQVAVIIWLCIAYKGYLAPDVSTLAKPHLSAAVGIGVCIAMKIPSHFQAALLVSII